MPDNNMKSLIVATSAGLAGGAITGAGAVLGFAPGELVWPVMAVCAVTGGLVHNAKHAITDMIDNRAFTLRSRMETMQRDMGDIHGLVRLQPYTADLPLPIGGGWALTGDSAAILVREALSRQSKTVLELGSGASTLLLGQVLKRRGEGRLLSIDHDPVWARRTRQYVDFLGLQDYVTVVDAPLKTQTLAGDSFDWYDIPAKDLDVLGPIDLLLVDGPPQSKTDPKAARSPAFALLRQRLSPRALVFVDDASRQTERSMVERWLAEAPEWTAQWFHTVDGVCLLTRDWSGQANA